MSTKLTHFGLTWNLSNNSKSMGIPKVLQLQKLFQITHSFSTNFLIPYLFFPGIFQFWQLFARWKKWVRGAEAGAGSACQRVRGTSMPHADRTQRRRAPLKARPFRPGRSEQCRRSPRHRHLIHAGETPSVPLSAPTCRSLLPFRRLQQS
jgi:hypothetical protein